MPRVLVGLPLRMGTAEALWVWLIGVANTKAMIVAGAVRFLAKPCHFFAVTDSLVAITARLSA